MLATPGSLPAAAEDAQWGYEFKWDGIRAIIRVDLGRVRITSRAGNDVTAHYPELGALGEALQGTRALLDGEIVTLRAGRPSFDTLARRMHVSAPAKLGRLVAQDPVTFLAFDVLHLDGRPCLDLCYAQRRRLLEGIGLTGTCWQTPPSYPGQGAAVVRASRQHGLEGVLAKRLDSRYQPGRRSPHWVKITDVRFQEVVIGGWRPGGGRRSDVLGSLLIGVPEPGGLCYVGQVGTGFTNRMLTELTRTLRQIGSPASPFATPVPRDRARGAQWVRPSLVGEVVFRGWTPSGRLRAPSWRGLRPDKHPEEVARGG
jgi:bifunctional non-homologous end joining protein LigD